MGTSGRSGLSLLLVAALSISVVTARGAEPRLQVQLGTRGGSGGLAFSPDGRWLASAADGATLVVWDVASGREIRRLPTAEVMTALAFREDEARVVGVGFSGPGDTKLWVEEYDLFAGTTDPECLPSPCQEGSLLGGPMSLSPDGRHLLVGCGEGVSRLLDLDSGETTRELTGAGAPVLAVALSDGGRYAATLEGTHVGGGGITGLAARVWHLPSGRERGALDLDAAELPLSDVGGVTLQVARIDFSSDSREILITFHEPHGEEERGVLATRWDRRTGRLLDRAESDGRRILAGEARRGSARIVLSTGNAYGSTVDVWEWPPVEGSDTHLWVRSPSGWVSRAAISGDGRWVALGGEGEPVLIDLEDPGDVRALRGFSNGAVNNVAFSPGGDHLITTSRGRTDVMVWDATDSGTTRPLRGSTAAIEHMSPSADGKHVVAGCRDHAVRVWDLPSGALALTVLEQSEPFVSVFGPGLGGIPSVVLPGAEPAVIVVRESWSADLPRRTLVTVGISDGLVRREVPLDAPGRYLCDTMPADAVLDIGGAPQVAVVESKGLGLAPPDCGLVSPSGPGVWLDGDGAECRERNSAFALWDLEEGSEGLRRELPYFGPFPSVDRSRGASVLAACEEPSGRVLLWDWEDDRLTDRFGGIEDCGAVALDGRGSRLLVTDRQGGAGIWHLASGEQVVDIGGHHQRILSAAFSPDGGVLLTGSADGTAKLWETATGEELCTLFDFDDGSWAVLAPSGRFDTSGLDGIEGMHWVFDGEPVTFEQLGEAFHTPGLLSAILRGEDLGPVPSFEDVELFPDIEIEEADDAGDGGEIRVRLTDRGGGIGPVEVFVNGKGFRPEPVRERGSPEDGSLEFTFDAQAAINIEVGQENDILVVPWNAEETLHGRGAEISYSPVGPPEPDIDLWAIVVGVSDYRGGKEGIDLRYAGDDATRFAYALGIGAPVLFAQVHTALLTDREGAKDRFSADGLPVTLGRPTRTNVVAALDAAKHARPEDVLVLFFAGHGMAIPGEGYAFLTAEASAMEPSAETMITGAEIAGWLRELPPNRCVLVLDTCSAGAIVEQLAGVRGGDRDRRKALALLRQGDRGLHILAGAAADRASYEAQRYGQGLLTHALLEGMSGMAVEDNNLYVSVLFDFAKDRAEVLAREHARIQVPRISSPGGRKLPLGLFTEEERRRVPVNTVKHVVERPVVKDEEGWTDPLHLADEVRMRIEYHEMTRPGGPLTWSDRAGVPGAVSAQVRYTPIGDEIRLEFLLARDEQKVSEVFRVMGDMQDLPGALDELVDRMLAEITALPLQTGEPAQESGKTSVLSPPAR